MRRYTGPHKGTSLLAGGLLRGPWELWGTSESGLSDWLVVGNVRLQSYGALLVVPTIPVKGTSVGWRVGGPLPLLPPEGSLEKSDRSPHLPR